MINESRLEFKDIQSEEYRTYRWSDGFQVTIVRPTHLHVNENGGHRVLDIAGTSHYIPSGWKHLFWKTFEGEPNFVK